MITNSHEDASLQLYMQEIARQKLLTEEEEIKLAEEIKKGSRRALDKLITSNLRLVVATAKQYNGKGVPFADLINEGNLALIKAAERYDHARGIRFASFAAWWVRQGIERAIGEQSRTPNVPQRQIEQINKINSTRTSFVQQAGRIPNINEIAQQTGIDETQVKDIMASSVRQLSFDAPIAPNSASTLLDKMSDNSQPLTDRQLMLFSIRQQLEDALCCLNEREQRVIKAFYGIGEIQQTFAEIGERYGFSRERARQIRNKALRHIRKHTSKKHLKTYL